MEQFINLKMLDLNDNKRIVAEKTYHIESDLDKRHKIAYFVDLSESNIIHDYSNVDTSIHQVRLLMQVTYMIENESGELVDTETEYRNYHYTNELGYLVED